MQTNNKTDGENIMIQNYSFCNRGKKLVSLKQSEKSLNLIFNRNCKFYPIVPYFLERLDSLGSKIQKHLI